MDEAARIRQALPSLPIFPLPGAVLLPHALVPLHIFEPRYRKMIRDCEAGSRVLSLANIAGETDRPPKVLPTIGVGVLARVEPLADGRFNIVLRGISRARIAEELQTEEPYRLVRAEALRSQPSTADVALADNLRRLVLALCATQSGAEPAALALLAGKARDPGDLADVVAGILLDAPEERQAILEELVVARRLELVIQAVVRALAECAVPSAGPN
ncbi:MAG TPA: LON peptidase substrate-binding domain-containing protein [Myxococcales bacterium]